MEQSSVLGAGHHQPTSSSQDQAAACSGILPAPRISSLLSQVDAMLADRKELTRKNTLLLHLSEVLGRGVGGFRVTSCKSAKDR